MFDLLVVGGTIVDGTGEKRFRADVGISSDFIQVVGDLGGAEATQVIDASGLMVAPGFIDTHVHSEGDLLINPQHANGLRQGITTELLGIDGMSFAPLSHANYLVYRRWLGGLLGNPPEDLDMSSVAAFRSHYHKKVSVNTAYLIPNGTLRLEVLGFRDLLLTGEPMKEAKRLLQEGMEQGAVGFSTGSSYYPGPWASTEELVELCEIVKDAGGVYMSEPRQANSERAFGRDGVVEAIEIARRVGCKLHLAHFRTDPTTAGRLQEHMALVNEAEAEGVDITLDIYPYPSGSTIPISFLPSEAQEGGPDEIISRLKEPVEKQKIVNHLETQLRYNRSLDEMVFSYMPRNTHLEGMSISDIALERDMSPGELLCDLLLEEDLKIGYTMPPPVSVRLWRQISQDAMELLARDDYMVCSDITPAGSMPHPRSFGAFPRFLGRLRRQFDILSLEQMVHRMTDKPARRFGLTKRGRIKRGYYADITVFDADHVIDTATYDDPRQYPVGIPYVIVNGQVAVDHERCTGVLAGQAVP